MDSPENELTQMIRRAGNGDAEAAEDVANRVYEELRNMAQRLMRSERQVTLQPTVLANEALLRLLDSEAMTETPDRAYFFGAAARAMRRIIVDEYRKRNAVKRGGRQQRQSLDVLLDRYERQNVDVLALDEALAELETLSPRQSRVVHLRWFMDCSVKEVADLLDISISTVEQDWRTARAFLRTRLDTNGGA